MHVGSDFNAMELFKTHLDAILCNMLWDTLQSRGWTRWSPVLSNLSHSMHLCESGFLLL